LNDLSALSLYFCCVAGVAHPWSSFDLSTILRYLASTMKAGDPMGILLLRTVLYRMSGIEGVSWGSRANEGEGTTAADGSAVLHV
jgi:hypothetical protein